MVQTKIRGMGERLVTEPAVFIPLLTVGVCFIPLGIGFLVYGRIFGGVIVLMLAGGTGGLLFLSHQLHCQTVTSDAAGLLLGHLKKTGLKGFELQDACSTFSIPQKHVFDACLVVYEDCVKQALKDLVITEKERAALVALQEKLSITAGYAQDIEKRLKSHRYEREFDDRMADGVITRKERAELQRIRSVLGLSEAEALEQTREKVLDGYRALFRRFACDGMLTKEEFEELEDFSEATGLSPQEAAEISRRDAVDLYRRTVTMACQDGVITDEELESLHILADLLRLPEEEIRPFRNEVNRVRQLADIRKGKLPVLKKCGIELRSTEICHWKSRCTYVYQTSTREKEVQGELVVTNDRVIFMAPERSLEFKAKRIANLDLYSNAVCITCTSTRGQGVYHVKHPDTLEAILTSLIRRNNFKVAEHTDKGRTRHIPDNVKVAVWQRDTGACVRCGAKEYLEFDHIIPFSRGGANTEKNVQLLCRKCNLAKSDGLV